MVEILVVLAIIAILMGLLAGGFTAVRRKMSTARTEANLNKVRIALESYKAKYGYYPASVNASNAIVWQPFCLDLNDPTVERGKMQNNFNQFIDFGKIANEESTVIGSYTTGPVTVNRYAVGDGWETKVWEKTGSSTEAEQVSNFIVYMCPGMVNQSSYDLFSAGVDRTFRWSNTSDVTDKVNTDNIWPQGLKRK
jgi:type II secretory pathway pseudopilin PulG